MSDDGKPHGEPGHDNRRFIIITQRISKSGANLNIWPNSQLKGKSGPKLSSFDEKGEKKIPTEWYKNHENWMENKQVTNFRIFILKALVNIVHV